MNAVCHRFFFVCASLAFTGSIAPAQNEPKNAAAITVANTPAKSTIALAPAVIMMHGQPGQSTTQTLTISNQVNTELRFEIEAQDVIVRDGKRVFVRAGQLPASIAAQVV